MSWQTAGPKRGSRPLNKDKVFSDLSALIDQAGGGEYSNGRQQGSGAEATSNPNPVATRALLAKGPQKQQQNGIAASAITQLGDQKSFSLM